jgi:hypothetical protein
MSRRSRERDGDFAEEPLISRSYPRQEACIVGAANRLHLQTARQSQGPERPAGPDRVLAEKACSPDLDFSSGWQVRA